MNSTYSNRRNGQAGITLIELMVVVVIIAILAAFGYPSYLEYIVRSNRQAARAEIYKIADRQEQFFLDNKAYADGLVTLGYDDDTISIGRDGQRAANDDEDRTYSLTITESSDTTYTIQATPQGVQAERDTVCDTLSLTSSGERGDSEGCW